MKIGFVQKCMLGEKTRVRAIIILIIFTITLFVGIFIYVNIGYILGVRKLQTNADFQKYKNSKNYKLDLYYKEWLDTKEEISISTKRQQSFVMLGSVSGEIPGATYESTNIYNVYLMKTIDDVGVIICSKEKLELSSEPIRVRNRYKDLSKKIIDEYKNGFDNQDNIYVLYVEENNGLAKGILIFYIITYIILFGILTIIKRSKAIQKHSRLGKSIKELGDYEKVIKDINEQVESPIFETMSKIITKDYFILYTKFPSKNSYARIIPIKNITNVISTPNPKYPDEIIEISIELIEETICFNVYNQEDEERILNYFRR